jgi:hypothetical protein
MYGWTCTGDEGNRFEVLPIVDDAGDQVRVEFTLSEGTNVVCTEISMKRAQQLARVILGADPREVNHDELG